MNDNIVNYDYTTGLLETPKGLCKYIEYDSNTKKVTVEFDGMYLIELDAKDCYIL